jgi:hypothetical protein
MKVPKTLFATVFCAIALAGRLEAVDSAISAKIGTLGIGGEFTWRVADDINIRGGLNSYNYGFSLDIEDTRVDANLALQSIPLLLDYHPFDTGFRVSAGAIINGNSIELSAIPDNKQIIVNGISFGVDSVDGEIKFSKFAPYIGVGFGNAVLEGSAWQFTCDFGLMFHGTPKATATAVASDQYLQDILDYELKGELATFNSDISGFTIWPVASVGISLNF